MAPHSNILAWGIPWTGAWQATIGGVAKMTSDLLRRRNLDTDTYRCEDTQRRQPSTSQGERS